MLEADLGVESQSPECSPVLEPLLTWVVPPLPTPHSCPISPHPPQGPAEKQQRPRRDLAQRPCPGALLTRPVLVSPQESSTVPHRVLQKPSQLLQEPLGAQVPPETRGRPLGGAARGATIRAAASNPRPGIGEDAALRDCVDPAP